MGVSCSRADDDGSRQLLEPIPKSQWIDDNEHTQCMLSNCNNTFSTTIRKHHCRYCGQIVCYKCSTQTFKSNRICDECHDKYINKSIINTEIPTNIARFQTAVSNEDSEHSKESKESTEPKDSKEADYVFQVPAVFENKNRKSKIICNMDIMTVVLSRLDDSRRDNINSNSVIRCVIGSYNISVNAALKYWNDHCYDDDFEDEITDEWLLQIQQEMESYQQKKDEELKRFSKQIDMLHLQINEHQYNDLLQNENYDYLMDIDNDNNNNHNKSDDFKNEHIDDDNMDIRNISNEWNKLQFKSMQNQCGDDVTVCYHLKRLLFILNVYNKWCTLTQLRSSFNMLSIIKMLQSYSMQTMFDDYIHCKDHDLNELNNYIQNESKLDIDCNDFKNNDKEIKKCPFSQRNYRDRTQCRDDKIRKDIYFGYTKSCDVRCLQTLDMMHCFLFHNMDKRNTEQVTTKFITDIMSKDKANENKEEEIVNSYSFGIGFNHWDKESFLYTESKFNNLKQELFENNIYKISEKQWNDTLLRAMEIKNCSKGKIWKSRENGYNDSYNLPPELPISLSHIMVILFYTNYEDLQRKFKKYGLRPLNSNESMEDIKKRNAEIAIWDQLLSEAVMFYGASTNSSQTFYHGINTKLLFSQFVPRFSTFVSTSTDISVANNFATINGILLVLKQHGSFPAPYIDVSWISDFPNERECLFCGCSELQINDIYEYEENEIDTTLKSNRLYLRALILFQCIVNGKYFSYILNEQTEENELEKTLVKMMINYMNKQKKTNNDTINHMDDIPNYIQNLFEHFVELFEGTFYYIQSEHDYICKDLRKYLINNDTLLQNDNEPETALFLNCWDQMKQIVIVQEYTCMMKGCVANLLLYREEEIAFLHEWTYQFPAEYRNGELVQEYNDKLKFKCFIIPKYNGYPGFTGCGFQVIEFPRNYEKIAVQLQMCIPEISYCVTQKYAVHQDDNKIFAWLGFELNDLLNIDTITVKCCFDVIDKVAAKPKMYKIMIPENLDDDEFNKFMMQIQEWGDQNQMIVLPEQELLDSNDAT